MARLRLGVCAGLAPEARAVAAAEGWVDVEVVAFPAQCGRGPDPLAGLEAGRPDDDLVVLGGTCIATTSAGQSPGRTAEVRRLDRCLSLLVPAGLHDHLTSEGAYLTTPDWVLHWPSHLAQWGFDQATARAFFGESTSRLVLLDTGVHATARSRLAELAAYLGLASEVLVVGLDHLRLQLVELVHGWRARIEERRLKGLIEESNRQRADYLLVLDMLGTLTDAVTEAAIVAKVLDLLDALFAPGKLVYLPFEAGAAGAPVVRPVQREVPGDERDELLGLHDEYAWTGSGEGFVLRVAHQGEILGFLKVSGFKFPEYKSHYLNLATFLLRVLGLAIARARSLEALQEALANVKTLRGLVPICSYCHKIRNDQDFWQSLETFLAAHSDAKLSHGICPECFARHWGPELAAIKAAKAAAEAG